MFEFAISQHRRRLPTKKFVASWFVSCFLHVAVLIVLMENPGLLRAGSHMWIRVPVFLQAFAPKERNWRTVAFVGKSGMRLPSEETLKRVLPHWNEGAAPIKAPPIRVRWGDEEKAPKATTLVPPVRPVLGTNDPKPTPEIPATGKASTDDSAAKVSDGTGSESTGALAGRSSATEKKTAVSVPAPESVEPRQIPKKAPETAENTSPSEIPKGTAPPQRQAVQRSEEPQIFKDEKSAIRAEGSGLFDTKGFPLGQYAQLIIERIKGNWSIPSNLRNSQGRSTLVFFIEKDGSVRDLKVVVSSGSTSLDLSALWAVLQSGPLPPLPGGFPGEHVGAKFVFSYNEP